MLAEQPWKTGFDSSFELTAILPVKARAFGNALRNHRFLTDLFGRKLTGPFRSCMIDLFGVWRSPVAHLVWDQGVQGSNPCTPTTVSQGGLSADGPFSFMSRK
jgi:hypothetical protein